MSTNERDWSGLGAIRRLLPYLWPSDEPAIRARVLATCVLLFAAKAATVSIPVLYKKAVDQLSAESATALALPLAWILAYGGARILSLGFAELRDAVFATVGQRAIRTVGLEVFRHLHSLSLRFHLERQTGGLSRQVSRGTQAIDTLLRFTLFSIGPTLFEVVLVFGVLWWVLDLRFALIAMATVVGYVGWTLWVTEWRLAFRRRMNEEDERATTRAIDSLLNFETVQYFGNAEHEARRYEGSLRAYERAAVRSQLSLSALNVGQVVIVAVGMTSVMWLAAAGILAGEQTLGDFVLVNTYLLQLYQPLGIFGFVYREIKQSVIDIEKMFALLDVERDVADRPGAAALEVSSGELEFDHVSFAYDERRPILADLSVRVKPGATLAIVGPSGAGKSTIGRLLFRFYDPTAGAVRIDGTDLREATTTSVRRAIGVVPQDTVLFNDTILYNLRYGRPEAGDEEVHRAAALARIDGFIRMLPDGYQTTVGERGLKLSGGEKQRVAIARTILKDPPILLLDEATSALDSATEREIQQNLRELSRGRTTIVIAHRLSTITHADEILVLDEGRVVERGRHEDLLARGGVYADMWQRQQHERRDDVDAA